MTLPDEALLDQLTPVEIVQACVWLIHNEEPYRLASALYGPHSDTDRFLGGLDRMWSKMDPPRRQAFVAMALDKYRPVLIDRRAARSAS